MTAPSSSSNPDPDRAVPEQYVRAAHAAFPDIAVDGSTLHLIYADTDAVIVGEKGGLRFFFPQQSDPSPASELQMHLLPYLRGYLTPEIPQLLSAVAADANAGLAVDGWVLPAGQPLRPDTFTDRNVQPLAKDIARFLAELHRFPVDRARTLGVASPRTWRESYEQIGRAVLPILRRRFSLTEQAKARRWWRDFLDTDRYWRFMPAVVHGSIGADQLLVDSEGRGLCAVIGWSEITVADLAIDFTGLVDAYGGDFAWRVLEAYQEQGMDVDPDLLLRVRRLSAAQAFVQVREAAQIGPQSSTVADADDAILAAAVEALRLGPAVTGEARAAAR